MIVGMQRAFNWELENLLSLIDAIANMIDSEKMKEKIQKMKIKESGK